VPAVGGDELDRPQAVDRQPELALEPAHPAAERQARDAGVDTSRCAARPNACAVVELAEQGPAVAAGDPASGPRSAAHRGEVDDRPVVAGGVAGQAVTAAADRDDQVLVPGEAERGRDLGASVAG
jgi:hypothetical protein